MELFLGVAAHTISLSTWKAKPKNLSEIEASLVYVVKPCLKTKATTTTKSYLYSLVSIGFLVMSMLSAVVLC